MRALNVAGLLSLVAAWPSAAEDTALGPLPGGAVSRSRMGPAEEVVLYFAFPPEAVRARLPEGLRLLRVDELATRDPDAAKEFEAHPERAAWARGFFEIIASPATYDGLSARGPERGSLAVWYAWATRTDGAKDPRHRGAKLVALGSWVADPRLAAHMRARGYPAEAARVRYRVDKAGRLRAGLDAKDVKVSVSCRLDGREEHPDWAARTTYQTIFTAAGGPPTFEVVGFRGHVLQGCEAPRWRMRGPGLLVRTWRAVGAPGEDTEYDAGYVLEGGLYRR